MKVIAAAILALGVLSTAASAQWCPPGKGIGQQRPTQGRLSTPIQHPGVPAISPDAPMEPAPVPADPVPQK